MELPALSPAAISAMVNVAEMPTRALSSVVSSIAAITTGAR